MGRWGANSFQYFKGLKSSVVITAFEEQADLKLFDDIVDIQVFGQGAPVIFFPQGLTNCPILGILDLLDITVKSSHLVDHKNLLVGWCSMGTFNEPCIPLDPVICRDV